MRCHRSLLGALVVCTTALAHAQIALVTGPEPDAVKAVHTLTQEFLAAHIEPDVAFLNSVFAEDARIWPPGGELVEGAAAIAKLNSAWASYKVVEFTETSRTAYTAGDLLIDEGTYVIVYGEPQQRETGNYINIWKRTGTDWKLYSNIWNVRAVEPVAP